MGFRYGKSIKLGKGVRLNVSKSGLGMSVGGKGARYTVHSSGRRTTTVGIPGTGMRYVAARGGCGARPTSSTPPRANAPEPPSFSGSGVVEAVRRQKPGLWAPKGEKAVYKAVVSEDFAALRRAAAEFPDHALAANTIAGLKLAAEGDTAAAKDLLAAVFGSEVDPAEDPFIKKYLPAMGFQVDIAPGVTAALSLSRDSIGLVLAEINQALGDLPSAIDVVERVDSTAHAAVSLADLYIEAGRYDDVVDLTEGIVNDDDSTALLCIYRGVALREKGYSDAARATFKEALKSKKREPAIRHKALIERAQTYLNENKKAQARKDLERILSEDSTYDGLQQALDRLND